MKKIVMGLMMLVLVGCTSATVGKEELLNELSITFNEEELILDYNEEFNPESAIEEVVGVVSYPEIAIDTTVEGEFEFTYTISNEEYEDVYIEETVTYTVNPELYIQLVDEVVQFEKNEVNNACDYVVEYIGVLVCPEYLDTSSLGTSYWKYAVYTEDMERYIEAMLEIYVVDNNPILEGATSEFKVTAGNSYNFDSVKATDYLGNELEVQVLGDWNSKVVGRYPLQYYAIDSDGREVTYDFTFVTVARTTSSGNSGSSSNNTSTGSSNSNGNTSNTGSTDNNSTGGAETIYACPNAVYYKDKPCDYIVTVAKGEKQFYGANAEAECLAYVEVMRNSLPEGAKGCGCSGLMNNLAELSGYAFGYSY